MRNFEKVRPPPHKLLMMSKFQVSDKVAKFQRSDGEFAKDLSDFVMFNLTCLYICLNP